ncbi:N-acetylmuramoyl-L-alanine amidase LytC precursor [Clostridium acetireducens DSM 10703]|uniref:N-acetylmuramoyl-L-alanine amidase LytC n=1 Tax=Clostridium acetireducens DSM 10703 TaxID=1121290 RepID=A0A1E8EY68_9CLOT|nr:cell wall-binding repeat-containing protein [Clostridium acetireducens]OFI05873.1 N-acetylmuramoyl-L-alanine amidase LytC precursor [Clostridium acetireducens DSM 10703]
MLFNKKFLNAAVLGIGLSLAFSFSSVKAASVNRKGGGDRYTTAEKVAEEIFRSSDNVVLVNGTGYADAVSATPLAKNLKAPILLTKGETLEKDVLDTINKLGAKNIYIVGGEGVVKEEIVKELKDKDFNVERLAKKGGTRFDTNAVVAREIIKRTDAKEAILVNGKDGYSDALSVASIAAKLNAPVLITSSSGIDKSVKDVIEDFDLKVQAVGGEAVVPDSIVNAVNGTRIAKGANRFETNLAVLNYYKDQLEFDNIYLASGGNDSVKNFADALVASAAAAKTGSPVVLGGLGANEAQQKAANDFIEYNMNKYTNIIIIGSTGVIKEKVEKDLSTISEYINSKDFMVIGIE